MDGQLSFSDGTKAERIVPLSDEARAIVIKTPVAWRQLPKNATTLPR